MLLSGKTMRITNAAYQIAIRVINVDGGLTATF